MGRVGGLAVTSFKWSVYFLGYAFTLILYMHRMLGMTSSFAFHLYFNYNFTRMNRHFQQGKE